MNKRKGFVALLAAGLLFGSMGVMIRILNVQLTVYQQIFLRNVVALILAFGITLLNKASWKIERKEYKNSFLYSFSFPISVICFTFAAIYTKIAIAVFGLYIGSLVASLIIGTFFFKERITRDKMVSLFLAGLGLLFLTYPLSLSSINFGLLIGIAAGCFDGIANAFRKHIAGKKDRYVLAGYQSIGGLIVSGILLLIFQQTSLPVLTPLTVGTVILFGFVLMSVMVTLLIGFKNFDLNLGTVVLSSELIFSLIFGIIFFQEYPTMFEMIGGLCIIGAISIPALLLVKKK